MNIIGAVPLKRISNQNQRLVNHHADSRTTAGVEPMCWPEAVSIREAWAVIKSRDLNNTRAQIAWREKASRPELSVVNKSDIFISVICNAKSRQGP